MTENKDNKTIFIFTIISMILFLLASIMLQKYQLSKYKIIDINVKDSMYLEIKSIYWNTEVRDIIVNDSFSLCPYQLFSESVSKDELFMYCYKNFRLLTKKSHNDTLITIDKNGQVRYYNVRSGPCYDDDE
ncbi:MAG: hypothetical protein IPK25_03410 [Saprospiraceae bacterium]|nr:hypothetical protein [Saprospiraceae bacterium]